MLKRAAILILSALLFSSCTQLQAARAVQKNAPGLLTSQLASVCEIVHDGAAFDGKRVSVRAVVIGGLGHGIVLLDDDDECAGGLRLGDSQSLKDPDEYLALLQVLLDEGGGFARGGNSRISARFEGLVEYRPKEHAKWVFEAERIFDVEVATTRLALGWVKVQVVKKSSGCGQPTSPAPGIILWFVDGSSGREGIIISDHVGGALVPLRPGSYCVNAYDREGEYLSLERTQSTCIEVERDRTIDFVVVVAVPGR